jgi:hypothetical protein
VGYDGFAKFENLDIFGLVFAHQATIACHIGAEDSGEFTLELLLCHKLPPGAEGKSNAG